jgi:8-oxo-dGTP diphosphatase
MVYEYEYPRPSVTLDAAVLRTPALEYPEILLIKRGNAPFSGFWALPGGFMEMEIPEEEQLPLFSAVL